MPYSLAVCKYSKGRAVFCQYPNSIHSDKSYILQNVNRNSPESFGDWMKTLREAKGLKQGELAEQMAWAQSELSRVESGQREPTSDFVVALAAALEIDVREALIRAGKPVYEGEADEEGEAIWREIARIIARLPADRREDALRWLNAYSLMVERENRPVKGDGSPKKARGTT